MKGELKTVEEIKKYILDEIEKNGLVFKRTVAAESFDENMYYQALKELKEEKLVKESRMSINKMGFSEEQKNAQVKTIAPDQNTSKKKH